MLEWMLEEGDIKYLGMIDPGQGDRVLLRPPPPLSIEGFTPLLYSPVGLEIELAKKGPKRLPEVSTSGARSSDQF